MYSVLRDSSGNLWVGTSGGQHSLICFSPTGKRIENIVDPSGKKLEINSVRYLLEEDPGTLLVGTRGNGLFRLKVNSVNAKEKGVCVIASLIHYTIAATESRHRLNCNYISSILRTHDGEFGCLLMVAVFTIWIIMGMWIKL